MNAELKAREELEITVLYNKQVEELNNENAQLALRIN